MQRRRATGDVQAAGQDADFADAALHAGLHRGPEVAQVLADFGARAPRVFVGEHQVGDVEAVAFALIQQIGAALERIGQFGGIGDDAVFGRFVLIDHETAADRIVIAGGDDVASGVVGGEAHAVGVERQFLALVHDQILLLVEADLVAAEQTDLLFAADAGQRFGNDVGIDLVRPMAFQPHQQRFVGAVAAAGHRERAEHFGAHPRGTGEIAAAAFFKPAVDEAAGGAHGPDRMRGARPDADLEQVERTDGHARIPGRCDARGRVAGA